MTGRGRDDLVRVDVQGHVLLTPASFVVSDDPARACDTRHDPSPRPTYPPGATAHPMCVAQCMMRAWAADVNGAALAAICPRSVCIGLKSLLRVCSVSVITQANTKSRLTVALAQHSAGESRHDRVARRAGVVQRPRYARGSGSPCPKSFIAPESLVPRVATYIRVTEGVGRPEVGVNPGGSQAGEAACAPLRPAPLRAVCRRWGASRSAEREWCRDPRRR